MALRHPRRQLARLGPKREPCDRALIVCEERLERAKVHATRALADAKDTDELDPSTEVHELVKYLQSLESESGTNTGHRSRNRIEHRDLSA